MDTIKLRASQLTGRALDWAVAVALGKAPEVVSGEAVCVSEACAGMKLPIAKYSTSWNDCYPVISQHIGKLVRMAQCTSWMASVIDSQRISTGESMEQAACRAFVRHCSRTGDIEVPEVLVEKLSSLPVGVFS